MTPTIHDSAEALKQMRIMIEAMRNLADLYTEPEDAEEEPDADLEEELINRIVEDGAEQGMEEDLTEKVFRLVLTYSKKSAE